MSAELRKQFVKLACLAKERDHAAKILNDYEREFELCAKTIGTIVSPVCRQAIVDCNSQYSEGIDPDSLGVAFDTEKVQIVLHIRIRYGKGYEPDDEFDNNDVKRLKEKIQPFMEKRLKEAGIDIPFGGIRIPPTYYVK